MRKKEEDKVKREEDGKKVGEVHGKEEKGGKKRTFMSELISATLELLIMYKFIVGRVFSLNFAL